MQTNPGNTLRTNPGQSKLHRVLTAYAVQHLYRKNGEFTAMLPFDAALHAQASRLNGNAGKQVLTLAGYVAFMRGQANFSAPIDLDAVANSLSDLVIFPAQGQPLPDKVVRAFRSFDSTSRFEEIETTIYTGKAAGTTGRALVVPQEGYSIETLAGGKHASISIIVPENYLAPVTNAGVLPAIEIDGMVLAILSRIYAPVVSETIASFATVSFSDVFPTGRHGFKLMENDTGRCAVVLESKVSVAPATQLNALSF